MDFFRGIAFLIFGLVAGLVGYQIGVSQNVAATVPAAGAALPAYYWYGPHMFGFGFLFPILFFFLFIALISAAIRGGRGWSSYGHDARRARFEELHRELHGNAPGTGTSSHTT